MADVVRHARLRWIGHLECKSGYDWVSSCRNMEMAGVKCEGKGRKTWGERGKDDMKLLELQPEWTIFRDMYPEGLDMGQMSNPSLACKKRGFSK